MMNVGAKWQAAIPPELAHGSAGRYPDVGANETLFGEIELLEIKPRSKRLGIAGMNGRV
jgi:FKBP-type peptidyl-prolyl cis-trans isomerase